MSSDQSEMALQDLIPNSILEDHDLLASLVSDATDFALSQGILSRIKDIPQNPQVATFIPFMLFPSIMPRPLFEQVLAIQTDFNLMVDQVSQDFCFLERCLRSTVQADEFIGRLFALYEEMKVDGITKPVTLGINRSDYMLDSEGTVKHLDDMVLWQVELNTIAASFGGVASKMLPLHRHVLRSAGLHHLIDLMPDNNPIAGIADAIICAWKLYKNPHALVLLVCHEFERNVFDQNCLQYILQERDVPFVRKTFAELDQQARLDDKRSLYIGQKEVAVVYYRTGYDPQQYDEVAWRVRRILERSLAACCPDIPTQLAGTKRVQQKLTSPDELSSLGLSVTCIARLQQTFTTIHGLDEGEEGDMAVQKALANPDQYVLKPQREGGGNNLYDEDMVRVLTSGQDGERGMDRAAYILMHRFWPPSSRNVVICPGAPCHVQPCVNELGVFGSYVRCGTEMILNNCCGHLLRSKSLALKDGGVMAGNAALNNPCLVPMSAQPLLKL